MSKFRKTISLFIVFVMSLGIIPITSASKLPDDVIGTKFEESVELLQALDIMVGDKDTGDFRLNDDIKRSEVAKIAVLLCGLGDVAESSAGYTKYPDVVADHWASGYINVATSQGLVIGDDVGTFRPDDTIKFAEAVTIFTRALGYEPSANDKGGYPNGYLVVAGQNGMLKNGVSAGADQKASRGTAAMLAFNSLTINLMEKTGYGSNETYEVVDKTLLKDKLEVEKIYGQVTANSHSTLNGSSSLKDGEVMIKAGNETDLYYTGNTDAEDFLARNVIAYVKTDNNDDKNLVLVRLDSSKTTELKVEVKDLEKIEGADEANKTLFYWKNENDKKPTEVTVSKDVKVFYNGLMSTMAPKDLLNLQSGHVELVDVNRDDEFDYIFVTEYRNLVVDEVSTVSYKINDKFNLLTLTLDPNDKNISFKIIKDGKEIKLEDIKEWDILSVAMDKANVSEASKFTVYVSNETVTGKISEIEDDKYTIGGKQYEIAANYTQANQPDLELNDEGIFYLDIEGKIAAVDTQTRAGSNYAYLVNAEVKGNLDDTLQLKLFTKDGETSILDATNKIKVNNKSNLTAQEAKKAIEAANGGSIAQLITYEVNAKGQVYYVNTAAVNSTPGTALKNSFSLDFTSYNKETGKDDGIEYKSANKKLGKFNLSDDTIVFDIPSGETDTANYAVRTPEMFVNKTMYNVDIFDLSEDLTAKVIIVKNSASQVNSEASIAVVEKISTTQNENNESVHKLYALQDGEKVQLLAKDDATLVKKGKTLETGDIIQYSTNSKGEIDKITLLLDSADRNNDEVNVYKEYTGTDMETVIGKVTKKFASSINVSANNMSETNYSIKDAKVYLYDYSKPSGSQVRVVDSSYITKYDEADPQKVFVRIYKGTVTEVVIVQSK